MATYTNDLFLTNNPYPIYDEMTETWLSSRIDLDAEYGLTNHKLCRKLYTNLDKRSKLEEVVKYFIDTVLTMGGQQALKANIETLTHYSPFKNCDDEDLIKAMKFVVDSVQEHLRK